MLLQMGIYRQTTLFHQTKENIYTLQQSILYIAAEHLISPNKTPFTIYIYPAKNIALISKP